MKRELHGNAQNALKQRCSIFKFKNGIGLANASSPIKPKAILKVNFIYILSKKSASDRIGQLKQKYNDFILLLITRRLVIIYTFIW